MNEIMTKPELYGNLASDETMQTRKAPPSPKLQVHTVRAAD